jgi:phosphohistidine phosphatase SixA
MKKLIIVRHGHYGDDLRLNDHGRTAINALATKLVPEVNEKSRLILTSTADRARQSAEIMSIVLGARYEEHGVLWSDSEHHWNLVWALNLVNKHEQVDILTLVTHLEYAEYFPAYFGKEVLKTEFKSWEINKAEAWIIDCPLKTLRHIC